MVKNQAFAAVLGPSGSGKSSVVYAGLLSQLRREGRWLVADLRPGNLPFSALANALITLLEPDKGEMERLLAVRQLAQALAQGELSLREVITRIIHIQASLPNAPDFLLVIDEFEQLYTLCPIPEVRQRFLEALLSVITATWHVSVTVIIIMRADFTNEALAYQPFADRLQRATLFLQPMTRDELQQAIEAPAYKLGASFDEGLVARILDDVGQESGNLPLLEFALTLLWDNQTNGRLTHGAYEAIGRVRGALTRHADNTYEQLNRVERTHVQRLLIQMVQPGLQMEDTRRFITRNELSNEDWTLVQRLADRRILVTKQAANGQDIAEIVHEALIRDWLQLRAWLDDNRDFLQWRKQLRAARQLWVASDKDDTALLQGQLLVEARTWWQASGSELNLQEKDFLQMSFDHDEHIQRQLIETSQRKKRMVLGGAMVLSTIVLLVTLSFLSIQRQATTRLVNVLVTRADLLPAEELDLALLLLLEAFRLTESAEVAVELQSVLRQEPHLVTFLHSPTGSKALSLAFSQLDESLLAAGYQDGTVVLWDLETKRPLTTFQGTDATGAWDLAFSSASQTLAVGGGNGLINLWDTENQLSLSRTIPAHKGVVSSLDFDREGKVLVSGSADGTILLWDIHSQPMVPTVTQNFGRPCISYVAS